MPFDGLRDFLSFLDGQDELVRVSKEISPNSFEISAILAQLQRNHGKAVIFDNLRNNEIPLCANLLGTFKRVAMALETTEEKIFSEWAKRKTVP